MITEAAVCQVFRLSISSISDENIPYLIHLPDVSSSDFSLALRIIFRISFVSLRFHRDGGRHIPVDRLVHHHLGVAAPSRGERSRPLADIGHPRD